MWKVGMEVIIDEVYYTVVSVITGRGNKGLLQALATEDGGSASYEACRCKMEYDGVVTVDLVTEESFDTCTNCRGRLT
jgi:hypothetical protein